MQYYGDRTSFWTDSERNPLIEKRKTSNSGTRSDDPPPSYASVVNVQEQNLRDPGIARKTKPVPVLVHISGTTYVPPLIPVQYSRTPYVPLLRTRGIRTDIEENTFTECARVYGYCVGLAALLIFFVLLGVRMSQKSSNQ